MATYNIKATTTWAQVALNTDTDLLITIDNAVTIEVATTTPNSAPTVTGHRVSSDNAITRSVLGQGYVWVRLVAGSNPAEVTLVVSK